MDTSSQQKLYQRHHFKRRLFSAATAATSATSQDNKTTDHQHHPNLLLQPPHHFTRLAGGKFKQAAAQLAQQHQPAPAATGRPRGRPRRAPIESEDEEDEFDELELRASLAFVEKNPPKVEDEMIFELQQVDQIDNGEEENAKLTKLAGQQAQPNNDSQKMLMARKLFLFDNNCVGNSNRMMNSNKNDLGQREAVEKSSFQLEEKSGKLGGGGADGQRSSATAAGAAEPLVGKQQQLCNGNQLISNSINRSNHQQLRIRMNNPIKVRF